MPPFFSPINSPQDCHKYPQNTKKITQSLPCLKSLSASKWLMSEYQTLRGLELTFVVPVHTLSVTLPMWSSVCCLLRCLTPFSEWWPHPSRCVSNAPSSTPAHTWISPLCSLSTPLWYNFIRCIYYLFHAPLPAECALASTQWLLYNREYNQV